MTGDTARLFVSIDLDDSIRKAMRPIDWWVDHLDGFRKIPPRSRHVTVAFIGDIAVSATDEIIAALDRRLHDRPAFAMPVVGMTSMPNEQRQRALAIELDAETGFADLALAASSALLKTPARERFADEPHRKPRPHITVARKKRSGGNRRVDVSCAPRFDVPIPCIRVDLIRSTLGPQGPIYTALSGWPLRGAG